MDALSEAMLAARVTGAIPTFLFKRKRAAPKQSLGARGFPDLLRSQEEPLRAFHRNNYSCVCLVVLPTECSGVD